MQLEFINPEELNPTFGWSHVVTCSGAKLVHLSGQTAVDKTGATVGKGDLRKQTEKTYENLAIGLAAAGATFHDVIKMNIYVVNLKSEDVPVLREIRARYINKEKPPASTLVGVQALVGADWLIEIDVIAALPE